MSWTSEFETPPTRPSKPPPDDADPDGSISDDGPLDPSVFDGLFADLDEPADDAPSEGDDAPDAAFSDQDGSNGFGPESQADSAAPATDAGETGGVGSDGELYGAYADDTEIEGFESVTDDADQDQWSTSSGNLEPGDLEPGNAAGVEDAWGFETTGWDDPDEAATDVPDPVPPSMPAAPATPAPTTPAAAPTVAMNGGTGVADPAAPTVGFGLGLGTTEHDLAPAAENGATEIDLETMDLDGADLETTDLAAALDQPLEAPTTTAPTDFEPGPENGGTVNGDPAEGHTENGVENGVEADTPALETLDPTQAGYGVGGDGDSGIGETTIQDITPPTELDDQINAQDGRWIPAAEADVPPALFDSTTEPVEQPTLFDPSTVPVQHETVFEAATEPVFTPQADGAPAGIDPGQVVDLNLADQALVDQQLVDQAPVGRPGSAEPNPLMPGVDPATGLPLGTEPTYQEPVAPTEGFAPATAPARSKRRWPSFVAAIFIGALLGGVLALALFQLVDGSDTDDEAATTSVPTAQDTTPGTDTPTTDVAPAVEDPAEVGRLELNSIRFRRSTTDLTPGSATGLDALAAAMVERPGLPLYIVVRSYSEALAADNLALSQAQAAAIVDHLAAAGADVTTVKAVGVGTSPLSSRQPVENFVIIDPGFGEAGLADVVSDGTPFAVGINPATNRLRPESLPYLDQLGEALNADPGLRIGLAGYSFDQLDPAGNRQLATTAVEAVVEYLAVQAGVEPDRISTLAPGDAQFIVPQRAGNHISVEWGEQAGPAADLADLDQASITFAPGTDLLTDEGAAVLDQAADILAGADGVVVIDAHAFSEARREDNQNLSELQAAAVARYLMDAEVPAERIRQYGSGSSRQFRDGSPNGRVVLSYVSR